MENLSSLWTAVDGLKTNALEEDLVTDVCVIGGGIAGLSVAYHLTRAGRNVVLLESRELAAGDTGMTTAHLSSVLGHGYAQFQKLHGDDGARLIHQSHQQAIDAIGEAVRAERIDCDYERLDGYLFLAPGHEPEELDREAEAAWQAGFAGVEHLAKIPEAPFDSGPCLRFPQQGRFHPLKYIAGLAKAIQESGGRIFTDSHVEKTTSGAEVTARTRNGSTVHAEALVVATNVPVNDRLVIHPKQAPYRTYAIGCRVPPGSVADHLYWDTESPYHYVRLQRHGDNEILIVGGEDHHTGHDYDPGPRFETLAAWARERFPIGNIEYRWSGQVMEPIDGVAFIGRNPMDCDNVYIVTGDAGNGMTHGTIAGLLITDLILGRENAWAELYDPSRVNLKGAKELFETSIHVAKHYSEWLTRKGAAKDVDEIGKGSGRVVWRDGKPIAAYRDEDGGIHEQSAVCPHAGCLVHWNNAETTWDCPCHGSAFAATGEVIHGPAKKALAPVERPVLSRSR